MTTTLQDWPAAQTEHGMLVALGEFLQQHGLIERLMYVPIPQKTQRFTAPLLIPPSQFKPCTAITAFYPGRHRP